MRPVYMMVTQDKYSLPLAVADTKMELARLCGVTIQSVCHSIANQRKPGANMKKWKYIEVWI